LKAIGSKFFHVLYPKESKMLLRECEYDGDYYALAVSLFRTGSQLSEDQKEL